MDVETTKNIIGKCSTIVLDIEGTTTSISYVKDELFPYAARYMEEYVKTNWNEEKMKEIVDILINDQNKLEGLEGFVPLPYESSPESEIEDFKNKVVSHLQWQQSRDFKSTGLKKLQGYIWQKGYFEGTIKGHMYEDVPKVLKYWKKLGKRIFIYSSGSIGAQKLLFSNSIAGDLDQYIDGNFDTTIGSKIESESYVKLTEEIKEIPENIVFFTDRPKEVVAAKKSGMSVIRMVREDDNPYLKEESEFLGAEDAVVESFIPLIDTPDQ